MSLDIVPATEISFVDFTALLNDTYRDYYVPLDMNVRQLRERVARDDIDLGASRVALADSTPVALGMLAQRQQNGWIGGVGVLPRYRRQGIGEGIMRALLDAARSNGIRQVSLEVIRQNTGARALYDKLGFRQVRMLHIAEGFPGNMPDEGAYKFQQVRPADALRFYDTFHTVPNPWQRERVALAQMTDRLSAMVALAADRVAAYAMGVFRMEVIRFVDLAHAPGQAGALRALVGELHRQHAVAAGSIINIGDDDPAWAVLSGMGYLPLLSQYEMTLDLGAYTGTL